ncbi:xylulokinase [Enterococcus timonensis]|uniref:xylulokinase n=1 Tax=Enterococcus timonensis TaxID=1852364 RepID=UPI0008D9615A|nr:FGGY-family carbohydrate kinase [Enterococcus timonensis]
MENQRKSISDGQTFLGIEFGSTRIKAVLIDQSQKVLASGEFEWENQFVDQFWTYSLEDIWSGLATCYENLRENVWSNYQVKLKKIGAIGISAMMHGYLAFDQQQQLLVPFRTWRNTNTTQAAKELSELFDFNIPERWSIAHLYKAHLNQENHLKKLFSINTLAGYVHRELTGRNVLGIGDASGMFPVDSHTKNYRQDLLNILQKKMDSFAYPFKVDDLLPEILSAGQMAGSLSEHGAKLLDTSGQLVAGIPLCPPEGDVGTGMVATNSIAVHTGNVSVGTSIFAMVVLESQLKHRYPEIDLVKTPVGEEVAMVHANNGTSEINAWLKLFQENLQLFGTKVSTEELYRKLFELALTGEKSAGNLLSYGYFSGESITKIPVGRSLFIRQEKSEFTLANFMRAQLFSTFATLKIGMDLLTKVEKVPLEKIYGHGGIFQTPKVGQKFLAAAINAPITVRSTANLGGAYGMALLAAFTKEKGLSLEQFLKKNVFDDEDEVTLDPDLMDVVGFQEYMDKFKKGLAIEQTAADFF